MWDRAERFDLEAGGRFDRHGAAVLVWSAPFDAAGDRAEPVGAFYVRWREPAEDRATIWRLEWDPDVGGSEDAARRAIAVLGGPETWMCAGTRRCARRAQRRSSRQAYGGPPRGGPA